MKLDRYTRLKETPESIDSTAINSFFQTFDLCEIDLNVLELIILKNPNYFLTFIDSMCDSEFFTFTVKLDDFPENSNTSKMKETLKESEQKSKRKKKVLRKIKKTKG